MNPKESSVLKSLITGLAAFVLLSVSHLVVGLISPFDLSQVTILFLVMYPFVAMLFGIASKLIAFPIWLQILIGFLVFANHPSFS